jgi:hypothetical protein
VRRPGPGSPGLHPAGLEGAFEREAAGRLPRSAPEAGIGRPVIMDNRVAWLVKRLEALEGRDFD